MKKILFYLLLAWLAFGCVTKKKCYSKFPPVTEKETVEKIVEIRDTTILGGEIVKILQIDTLNSIKTKVLRYVDTSGKTELSFYRNAYGELVAKCESKDQTIKALNKTVKQTKNTVKVLPPVIERKLPWWAIPLITILAFLSIPTAIQLIKFFTLKP